MCSFDGGKKMRRKAGYTVQTVSKCEAFFRGFQYKNDLKTG